MDADLNWLAPPSPVVTCIIITIILPAKSTKALTAFPPSQPSQRTKDEDDDAGSRMIGPGYLEDNLEHGAPLPERYFLVGLWGTSVPGKSELLTHSVMLSRARGVLLREQCFTVNA